MRNTEWISDSYPHIPKMTVVKAIMISEIYPTLIDFVHASRACPLNSLVNT